MNLRDIQELTEKEIQSLQSHWINTAEEFLALISSPDQLKKMLGVNNKRLKKIKEIIRESIPESEVIRIQNFKRPELPTGSKKIKK